MAVLIEALQEILRRTMAVAFAELMVLISPIWIAFLVGVMVGWAWKPNWAKTTTIITTTSKLLRRDKLKILNCSWSNWVDSSSTSPSSGVIRSPLKGFGSAPCFDSFKIKSTVCEPWTTDNADKALLLNRPSSVGPIEFVDSRPLRLNDEQSNVNTEEDLKHLYLLVETKDGGPAWIHMMDRSTPTMSYEAWRRDPKDGPPQYRSRTIFEDATPEIVRDFFWDDKFRAKWDDMLAYSLTLEECPTTGTMVVQWVRKFPFFCSDREYIIGRRIWESGRTYYCITKGVPNSVPRLNKPRRVDLYYSSWFIRPVESKSTGQLTACEVLLFHHEDMGIPWEIAKLGVRQGMWGTVKKIEPGLRAYQKERAAGAQLSRSAFVAQINTKVSPELLKSWGGLEAVADNKGEAIPHKRSGPNIPKLLIFGGAIVLACSVDRGLLTKTFIFGVARRFTNIARRP